MINFNEKIIRRILSDLRSITELNLSCCTLEKNVQLNMGALDSNIQSNIKDIIEMVLSKIEDHRQEQFASTLNTIDEGTPDQTLPVGNLLDSEIVLLEKYISENRLE